jgi:hypothetical protein
MIAQTQQELNDAKSAYFYAYKICKRLEQHEAIIATHPYYAYCYARDIIKGRWELGEAIIATDPQYAYSYAISVIKERFELGEAAIATNPCYAYEYIYYYARDVIHGRFELGESAIAKTPELAYRYAKFVLRFSIKNKTHIDFYEQCFRNNTININQLPKKLRDDVDIQIAYFKAKVLT